MIIFLSIKLIFSLLSYLIFILLRVSSNWDAKDWVSVTEKPHSSYICSWHKTNTDWRQNRLMLKYDRCCCITNAVLLFLMATAYCFYYGDDCFAGWLINERAFESYFQLGPLLDLTILILVALWHTLSKIYVPANSLNLDIFEWSYVKKRCYVKKVFLEFSKIHRKTPVSGSLF